MAGLRTIPDLQCRLAQRFGLRRLLCPLRSPQLSVKTDHQISCARRFDLPLTDYGRWDSRDKQRPGQTDHAFTCIDAPARRFAGREHGQLGLQIELHQLPGFEQPILVPVTLREHQMGIHRRGIVQNAVSCEVQYASAPGLGLDPALARLRSRIDATALRAVDRSERLHLRFGLRQRDELRVAQRQFRARNRFPAKGRITESQQRQRSFRSGALR